MSQLGLLDNPVRYWRRFSRRNPMVRRVSRDVSRNFFRGNDLKDVGISMAGLIGTQMAITPVVKLMSPGGSSNAWWVEPLASAIAAAGVGYAGAVTISQDVGKHLALGGAIAAGLNILKRIPAFQGLVSPGSITIGGLRPPIQPRPYARPIPYPPPSGRGTGPRPGPGGPPIPYKV